MVLVRTTPPQSVEVTSVFPELAPLARYEDQSDAYSDHYAGQDPVQPTKVEVGSTHNMQLYVCLISPEHPHTDLIRLPDVRPLRLAGHRLRTRLPLDPPRVLQPQRRQPRPQIRQPLPRTRQSMLDPAALQRVRRPHRVNRHPPVRQSDPPILGRHEVRQHVHTRLQQNPVVLQRRNPILR